MRNARPLPVPPSRGRRNARRDPRFSSSGAKETLHQIIGVGRPLTLWAAQSPPAESLSETTGSVLGRAPGDEHRRFSFLECSEKDQCRSVNRENSEVFALPEQARFLE